MKRNERAEGILGALDQYTTMNGRFWIQYVHAISVT